MKLIRQGAFFAEYALGDAKVVALSDGNAVMKYAWLIGVDFSKPEFAAKANTEFLLSVQAFLVEISGQRVLIDAGAANAWYATAGKLYDALAEAGIARESITVAAITHCHSDHINGLVMPDGGIAFPNASRIFVPTTEHPLFKAKARLAPVFAKLQPLNDGDMVIDGITAVATHGHEVGHTSYWVSSRNEKLLVWGDIVHKADVQFADPDIVWEYDADKDAARTSRKRVLELVAREHAPVAGAHLDFPGVGLIFASGPAYRFQPLS